MKTAACRSCGEPIIWTVTKNDKRMPVDAEPVPPNMGETLFVLTEDDDEVRAEFVPPSRQSHEGDLYISHFATCPHADQHRRPR